MAIHQLAANDFEKAAVVLANLAEWNVYLTAVLQQNSLGRIYVDNVAKPRSAFAVSLDCAYLAGDPHNASFNAGVTEVLEATLLAGDRVNPADPELAICVDSPDWEAAVARYFECSRASKGDAEHSLFATMGASVAGDRFT